MPRRKQIDKHNTNEPT